MLQYDQSIKAENGQNLKNYTSVSLISYVTKCFEWLMGNRLTKYLKVNNLYNTNQLDFLAW